MKRHENAVANLWKSFGPADRAYIRRKGNRRRSSLQDGVIHVRIVKIGELRPPCEVGNCQEEANYHYNGGHYCWQHRPAPDYNGMALPPAQCLKCGALVDFEHFTDHHCEPDGMAICADCKRSYYQADGEGCQCHVCWAASLTPPSPQWNSQAVCYKVGCNRSGVHEFEMAFWCDEHYAEFQQSPWPGGAA